VAKGRDHGRSTTATRQPLEGATGGNVGTLYLADGRGGTLLNTDMLTWTFPHVSGVLPHPRAGMTLTALGGRLFLFGGSGTSSKCFHDLQILDRKEMAWLDVMHSDNNQQWGNNGTNNSTNNGTPHVLAPLSHTSSCRRVKGFFVIVVVQIYHKTR
jgi:hypothetical protein